MSKSKAKGTAFETAIVRYLKDEGFSAVERRTLGGVKDRGDIAGIPGLVIEAKSCAAMTLAAWIDEADAERVHDDARLGVVWHKRRGQGSPGSCYVSMTGATFVNLLTEAGY